MIINKNYLYFLLNISNKYFNKPYKDDYNGGITVRIIDNRQFILYRMNHGICHSIRQGLLSLDIINTLQMYLVDNKLSKWIYKKNRDDIYFKRKIMFTSIFQRSGRESEVNSVNFPDLYKRYERNDAKNFEKEAIKYKNYLHFNNYEILLYKESILWSTKSEGILDEKEHKDLHFIRKILHSSHLLDLQRIPFFDLNRIKIDIKNILFDNITDINKQKFIIDILLNYSKKYLEITGDRNIINYKVNLDDKFFILSNNIHLLCNALYKN